MRTYKSSIVWRISKEYFTKLVNESKNCHIISIVKNS